MQPYSQEIDSFKRNAVKIACDKVNELTLRLHPDGWKKVQRRAEQASESSILIGPRDAAITNQRAAFARLLCSSLFPFVILMRHRDTITYSHKNQHSAGLPIQHDHIELVTTHRTTTYAETLVVPACDPLS